VTPDKIQSYIELLAFALLSALVISYLLTPAVMKLGFLLGMVDEPGGRRIHENPTPRCGGLAVYLAFAATLALMCCAVRFPQIKEPAWIWAQTVLFAGTPLIVLGLIDDRWEVRPHVKLLGQIAIAAFAWNQGFRLEKLLGVEIIQALDLGATIFLYVAGMNAYNLIDGMDGVAAGLGAITGLGLAGLNLMIGNESMAAFCLALTGGCLGFLRFNFHPARVFLGDTGSMFIGYVLISLTLGSQARSTAVIMLIIPLLTMGVPMIDTGLAIWRRSVRRAMYPEKGGKVSVGDKDHLHHRLARRGLTQRRVAGLLYGLQAVVFLVGLLWVFLQSYRLAIFTVGFFAGSYVLFRYLASLEMTDSGRWIVDGIRRPGRMQLYSSLMPFMDVTILGVAFLFFSWLFSPDYPGLALNILVREAAAPVVGGPLIFIWAARYYRPQWTRARALDFFYLGLIATAGILVGFVVSPLPLQHSLRETLIFCLVFLTLTIPPMVTLRAFPRLVQDMLHYHERQKREQDSQNLNRVLVYGAGYGYTLITRAESFADTARREQYHLVGLIDDDPFLKNRMVHGHQVLGGLKDLRRLVEEQDIDEILVSTILDPENEDRLMGIAEEMNLRVKQSLFNSQVLRDFAVKKPGDSALPITI